MFCTRRAMVTRRLFLPLKIMNKYQEIAEDFVSKALEGCEKIRFDSSNSNQLFCLTIFGHCLELFSSIKVLYSADNQAGSRAVLRQMMESYVDLINLLEDSNGSYLKSLEAADRYQWSKLIKASEKGNPYVTGLDEAAKVAKLETEKEGGLKIYHKFENAGQSELYKGAYAFACLGTHNNLSELCRRYINHSEKSVKLSYFHASSSPVDLMIALDIGVKASKRVFQRYNVAQTDFDSVLLAMQEHHLAQIPKSDSKLDP
jgi:Family of unknown function (DUF5677)